MSQVTFTELLMRTHTIAACSLMAIAAQGWCSQALASSDPEPDSSSSFPRDRAASHPPEANPQDEVAAITAIAAPEVQFLPSSAQASADQSEIQPTLSNFSAEVTVGSRLAQNSVIGINLRDRTPSRGQAMTIANITPHPQLSPEIPSTTHRPLENLLDTELDIELNAAAVALAPNTAQNQAPRTTPNPQIAQNLTFKDLDLETVILIETGPPKMRLPKGTKLPMRMIVATDSSITTDTPITDQMEPFIQSTTPSLTTGEPNSGLGASARIVEQSREEYSRALNQWAERVRESMQSSPRLVHTTDPKVELVRITDTDPDRFVPIVINRRLGRIVRNANGRLVYTSI